MYIKVSSHAYASGVYGYLTSKHLPASSSNILFGLRDARSTLTHWTGAALIVHPHAAVANEVRVRAVDLEIVDVRLLALFLGASENSVFPE